MGHVLSVLPLSLILFPLCLHCIYRVEAKRPKKYVVPIFENSVYTTVLHNSSVGKTKAETFGAADTGVHYHFPCWLSRENNTV